MERIVVTILADRLPEATVALDKLVRKAARLRLGGFEWKVVREWVEEQKGHNAFRRPTTRRVPKVDLEIAGEPLVYGDHEFLARLEVTPEGVLVDTVPSLPEGGLDVRFRTSRGDCEHCRVNRTRRHLFVLRDRRSGAQIQVGRQCLRPYLGMDNPESIAARFRFWAELREFADEERGFRAPWSADLEEILTWTAVAVRLHGWVSRAVAMEHDDARATAGRVGGMLNPRPLDPVARKEYDEMRAALTEEDAARAAEIVRWVREELSGSGEYVHNLKVLFQSDYTNDPRRVAIVASAHAAHARAMGFERERRAPRPESAHFGETGERLRDVPVVFERKLFLGTGEFGDRYLYKFRTPEGNIVTWATGKGLRLDEGAELLLTGTVKRHTEFRGEKQTELTRCAGKEKEA